MTRLSKNLTVLNPLGLHARPAAEFVRCANSFKCALSVETDNGACYDAKSIMGLLMACLAPGSSFVLHAEGLDAPKAIKRLEELLTEIAEREGLSELARLRAETSSMIQEQARVF